MRATAHCWFQQVLPVSLVAQELLFRVLAAQEDSQEIAFFQTLPDEVSNQTVLLGTPVEELYLPDTLEAVVLREQEKEDVEDSEDGEIKDEDKLPEETFPPDEDKTDEKDELGGTGSGEEDSGENNEDGDEPNEENPDENLSGEEDDGNKNNSGEDNQEDSNSGGETAEGTGEDSLGENNPGAEGTDGDNSGENNSDENNNTQTSESQEDKGADAEADNENSSGEAGINELSKDIVTVNAQVNYARPFGLRPTEIRRTETVSENDLITGGEDTSYDNEESSENTSSQIVEETIVLSGITWESAPLYDGETPGAYVFTPVLPEGYTLMQGLTLPQIFITVLDAEDGGKIELLVRPYDEENSSHMVYYLKDVYDSY